MRSALYLGPAALCLLQVGLRNLVILLGHLVQAELALLRLSCLSQPSQLMCLQPSMRYHYLLLHLAVLLGLDLLGPPALGLVV